MGAPHFGHARKRRPAVAGLGLHVLCVEDDEQVLSVLAALLENEWYEVTAATTAEAGLAYLGSRHFHLIVTDIRLGGQRDGGLQVMAAAGFISPEATVIALTAFPDDDNRQASLRLGATHFI